VIEWDSLLLDGAKDTKDEPSPPSCISKRGARRHRLLVKSNGSGRLKLTENGKLRLASEAAKIKDRSET
jgi:hypothetical protein